MKTTENKNEEMKTRTAFISEIKAFAESIADKYCDDKKRTAFIFAAVDETDEKSDRGDLTIAIVGQGDLLLRTAEQLLDQDKSKPIFQAALSRILFDM